ncbi:IclR family transcriptional regulator [Halocatena pleomorpha]|uniref:IclR family transcriptional regulator n=1 Tax=Halocatena pleomorpha TaxID=1785090 RepID=A0A3P3R7R7_9EURY|nr:IclR family transcriptional regulator [Halocatena pleomorpha]RRJ29512.1 IclR family transcriptional regulator [Halocatena pleomorpha]
MTDHSQSGSRRLKSVKQAFDIIQYLRDVEGATLSQTAEDLDIPVSTAHIHLTTLVDSNFVIKKSNEYRCSFRFLQLGGEKCNRMILYRAAKPELDDLREMTSEHTNVTVEEDGYAVQLYKSQSPDSIDDNAPLGDYLYLHSTATGKAILSELPEKKVDDIFEKRGLPSLTEDTITDEESLRQELEEIRERGYSINRGEHFPGVCAVGTAIVSEPDNVVGAISISGPLSRMGTDRIEQELATELLNKKNIIELRIKKYQ